MADQMHWEGLKELFRKIDRLSQLRELRALLLAGGAHYKRHLQAYPGQRSAPQPFKTEKQRRFFFYALNAGKIQVPYMRGSSPTSRNLKQQWTVTAESDTRVVVGNATDYGPWVQSREQQAAYHRATGWPTVEDVEERESPAVSQYVIYGLQRIVDEA